MASQEHQAPFKSLWIRFYVDLPFVTTYLDDVLVHSQSIESHKKHLKAVFKCLKAAGLTLRGSKCHIGLTEVSYLGHVFSSSGMRPDPRKVEAVRSWPTPPDVSATRQFLGLPSYYRRYIPSFADIAAPLTQKGIAFNWTRQCELAFTTLKNLLI